MPLPRIVLMGSGKRIAVALERVADALEAILLAQYGVRTRAGKPTPGTEAPDIAYDDGLETLRRDFAYAEAKRQGRNPDGDEG